MNATSLTAAAKPLVVSGLAVVLVIGLTGCLGKAPRQTQFMKSVGGVSATAEELRLTTRDGAQSYAGVIESAANTIMERTSDPAVRRNALMWKARAIPTSQQALFRQDPLLALIDAWAFTVQMRLFFEEGPGQGAFGEQQSIAIDACTMLEEAIVRVAVKGAEHPQNVPEIREEMVAFAREYPIVDWTFARSSVPKHIEAFDRARAAGGLAAAGTLVTDLSDLSFRIGLIADEMPRRIMWETELLTDSYVNRAEVDRALSDLSDIPDSMDNLRLFAEQSVAELLAEKEAMLADLQGEFGSLGEIYTGTLAFIRAERMAATADLQRERAIALEALQAEREIALRTIDEQRALVMRDVAAIADDTVDRLGTRAEGVIDHFFLRLAQLLLALIVVAAIGGHFLMRALKS